MSKKITKPVSIVLGTALASTLTVGSLSANAEANNGNPFTMKELSGGYMQLAQADATEKPASDSQHDNKKPGQEGKCGEGKCGNKGEMKKNMEGKCGEKKSEKEGKCGEGKCGSNKK